MDGLLVVPSDVVPLLLCNASLANNSVDIRSEGHSIASPDVAVDLWVEVRARSSQTAALNWV